VWVAAALGAVAVYLILAPVSAGLSAVFPRAVNLNSIGKGGNPHQLANLLGLAAMVLAAAPPIGLTLVAVNVLHQPRMAMLFVGGWCGIAAAVHPLLIRAVEPILAARRENLVMVASGK
jgi:hypothetical protein